MKYNIKFWSMEKYLPSKRHRKLRERYVENNIDIEIAEPNEKDFPIAFIVHDYQSVYDDAKSCNDFNGTNNYEIFAEEVRTYNNRLYKPVRITHGSAISLHFESLDYIKNRLTNRKPYNVRGEEFTENSIIKESNIEEEIKRVKEKSKQHVIFNNVVWEGCGEPMYNITTFGLGHNHGGTGFFIDYQYNSNISNKNYFNALEREKAIAYGKQVALNRGDTESVERMGIKNIEVKIPEMVKRNPQQEHGEGDPFINSINAITEGTTSAMEAGILSMALLSSELSKD